MRHPRWIAGGFDEPTRNWKLYAAIVEQMKKFYSVSGWWRWQSSVRQISFLCSERKFIHFQIKSMINLFSADTFSHQYFPAYIPFHKYALINNMNIRTRNLAHRWIERLADDQSKTPFLPKWCSTTSLIPIYNTIHFQNYTDFLWGCEWPIDITILSDWIEILCSYIIQFIFHGKITSHIFTVPGNSLASTLMTKGVWNSQFWEQHQSAMLIISGETIYIGNLCPCVICINMIRSRELQQQFHCCFWKTMKLPFPIFLHHFYNYRHWHEEYPSQRLKISKCNALQTRQ